MNGHYDVVIIGGGIAGLAALRALHAKGISALILERRTVAEDGGLAINLPGNAIRALGTLGLSQALQGFGRPVARREYRTERDRLLFGVDEAAFWGTELTPRCLPRRDLTALLAQGLPQDAIRRGVAVESITREGAGVRIRTSDQSDITARLVIGADGVNSTVRAQCFDGAATASARLASASWRFMAPNPGVDCWTVWAGAQATVLLIPVAGDQAYGWIAANGSPRGTVEASDLGALVRHFPAPVEAAVKSALANPQHLYFSPLDEVRLPNWTQPGVVLIGDAAHATAPVWAQGAALALEDALVLADLLAVQSDWDAALLEYERSRRPRVEHVQAMTDRMSKAARLPIFLRNLLLPRVGPRSYEGTYGVLKEPAVL